MVVILLNLELDIVEYGKEIKNMGKEFLSLEMAIFMRGIEKMENKMGKVNIITRMEMFTKANLKKTKKQDMEHLKLNQEKFTSETSSKLKDKVQVN